MEVFPSPPGAKADAPSYLMFASGGYPWTVIPLQRRDQYMAALESASVGGDIKPFAQFLASLIGNTGPPP